MKKLLILLTLCSILQATAQTKGKKDKKKTPEKTQSQPDATPAQSQADKIRELAESITAEDMQRHLKIIASDSMEGRETGQRGQKMAASYIADHFFYRGLNPVIPLDSVKKSYFQTFNLVKRSWGDVYIKNGKIEAEFIKDFFIAGGEMPQETPLELVFVGYGIETDKYSDYKNLDVTGKAVVFLNGEPKDKKGNYLATGTKEESGWADDMRKKINLAKQKGAKLILTAVKSDKYFSESMEQYSRYMTQPTISYSADVQKNTTPSVTAYIRPDAVPALFNQKEKNWKKQLKKLARGKKAAIDPITVKFKAERKDDAVPTENVIGFLEGTDKKDEIIVISAHYDHIGISADGKVNNGADDDGSGTTAVLELAEAFGLGKSYGLVPRRSILFVTVTGEEKGLYGSRYYTENPAFPLKNTVADLNIDMIGRIDKAHQGNADYIYLIGSDKLSSELHKISEDMNAKHTKLQLDYTYNDEKDPNRFYYRSDHYNFAKNGIPVIFYFNGVHEDYHQPTDDVEKINFKKMEKITRLVFYTAWELANREERIKVDSNKK
jgi:hypothetical protein